MTRVAVIGNAGGGKSTMCRALSKTHGLPYFAVDKIQWKPGWVLTPEHEYDEKHRALIAKERWLVDGFGSWPSILERFSAADTIIFVDHPIWIHYWWATKRQIKSIFGGRPDGPEGCPMLPVTLKLYRMMWHLHRDTRPKLLELVQQLSPSKRVIHIRSPRELMAMTQCPAGAAKFDN